MKKMLLWMAGGLGLATACGLAGLPHLSATLVTLTVFCALHVLTVWSFDVVWSLPDRMALWIEPSAGASVDAKRQDRG